MNHSFARCLWVIRDYLYVKCRNLLGALRILPLRCLAKFGIINKRKIIFNNFNGKSYGDNPKYIADEILRRNLKWDLAWITNDLSIELPKGVRAVAYGGPEEWLERKTAKVWIDNVRYGERPAKKRGQICLQTWHGGLNFKNVEAAVADKLDPEYVEEAKQDGKNCDGILSGCGLRTADYQEHFWLNPKTEILEYGLPRNDALFDKTLVSKKSAEIRGKLHLSKHQRIILYMPTFRDDQSVDGYTLEYEKILNEFEDRFQSEFAMIVRLHPNVKLSPNVIPFGKKIINATLLPDAQELYMVADYMITDYSSAAFDFSLLGKPVFLCMLDFQKYLSLRGVNDVFYSCPFPHSYSCEELLQQIQKFDEESYTKKLEEYKRIWKPFDDGHAAERTVDWIMRKMEE